MHVAAQQDGEQVDLQALLQATEHWTVRMPSCMHCTAQQKGKRQTHPSSPSRPWRVLPRSPRSPFHSCNQVSVADMDRFNGQMFA